MKDRPLRIWIDLANTPHVLFFEPVVRELERLGHTVTVTARRFANTLAVLAAQGVTARRIGAGHDASRSEVWKQAYYYSRTLRLMAFARRRFDVAASHLSYTQAEAARRLGIPLFVAIDYEHARFEAFRSASCLMVPRMVSPTAFERWGISPRVVRQYDGLKEHVYLANFRPQLDVRRHLGIAPGELLVTFRPIAAHAHYGNGDGHGVERQLLTRLAAEKGVRVLVLPRTLGQQRAFEEIARALPAVRVSREAIHGPSLIDASDLVVTGGGTMLREAAVLGVPAVSCFSGPLGGVDRWLAEQGRATLVRGADDLCLLRLEKCTRQAALPANGAVLSQIVQGISDAAGWA